MLYHYTDRDSAREIIEAGALRAEPVRVRTALIGGEELLLARCVWFTRSAEVSPTVKAKLAVAGWPLDRPEMLWRFGVADGAVPLDLPAWAYPHGYDPQLFRWMLVTAHVAGERWEDWRLSDADVPRERWLAVESLGAGGWAPQPW